MYMYLRLWRLCNVSAWSSLSVRAFTPVRVQIETKTSTCHIMSPDVPDCDKKAGPYHFSWPTCGFHITKFQFISFFSWVRNSSMAIFLRIHNCLIEFINYVLNLCTVDKVLNPFTRKHCLIEFIESALKLCTVDNISTVYKKNVW